MSWGIADRLAATGFRDDVPELLSLMDIYVITSRNEALGTAALEAMAMGKPVVASRIDGLTESAAEGADGAPPHARRRAGVRQAALDLACDPVLRERMGRNGSCAYRRTLLAPEYVLLERRIS